MLRSLVLLSALVLPATPALAIRDTPPEPGVHYRVSDRAFGAVEVKASPSIVGETVATFDASARDVVVTGRVSIGAGRMWWEVVHPGPGTATGWTASRFLTPVDESAAPETGYALECNGRGPDWLLAAAEGQARFNPVEGAPGEWKAGEWLPARGQKGRFVVALSSPQHDATGYLVVSRTLQYCRVGGTGLQYPFDATLIAPSGMVLGGCCYRAG